MYGSVVTIEHGRLLLPLLLTAHCYCWWKRWRPLPWGHGAGTLHNANTRSESTRGRRGRGGAFRAIHCYPHTSAGASFPAANVKGVGAWKERESVPLDETQVVRGQLYLVGREQGGGERETRGGGELGTMMNKEEEERHSFNQQHNHSY